MKPYTDIEQSKKLAEILPVESADMYWWSGGIRSYIESMDDGDFNEEGGDIRAWSLAALLELLESEINGEDGETYQLVIEKDGVWWDVWYKDIYGEASDIETESAEELIDACYEILLELSELNLL
jgi:hypothetical protein